MHGQQNVKETEIWVHNVPASFIFRRPDWKKIEWGLVLFTRNFSVSLRDTDPYTNLLDN